MTFFNDRWKNGNDGMEENNGGTSIYDDGFKRNNSDKHKNVRGLNYTISKRKHKTVGFVLFIVIIVSVKKQKKILPWE